MNRFILLSLFCVALAQCQESLSTKNYFDFKMSPLVRDAILHDKRLDVFWAKDREWYLKNPVIDRQRQCFEKFPRDQSIDFVIDLAPSPSRDDVDRRVAYSPIGLYTTLRNYDITVPPSKIFFDYVQDFIDAVAFQVKPESTHSILFQDGRKYYLRGRSMDEKDLGKSAGYSGDFVDLERNLKTLWPVPYITMKSEEDKSPKQPVTNNNLGRMTKLSLWNRDNGLPTVLFGSERSKPLYTIVITDGASKAKISDLTKDLSRTTVIDIAENRFVDRLSWDEMKSMISVISLPAPQNLPIVINSIRNMLCWLIEKP